MMACKIICRIYLVKFARVTTEGKLESFDLKYLEKHAAFDNPKPHMNIKCRECNNLCKKTQTAIDMMEADIEDSRRNLH